MSRMPLLALALLAGSLAPASPATAEPDIRFEIRVRNDDFVQLNFRRDDRDGWNGNNSNWGQSLALSDLRGITRESIEKGGPVSFAYIRPAGRFDCTGRAHDRVADGRCTFTANAAFARLLAARGIETPTRNQSYGLAMSGVDSDVIDAVIREGLGTPTPEQLIGLGVFKVTPEFVRAMAHIDGMKIRIGDLVQFRIFRITPESVRAYAALGYRSLTAADLVKFSIHRVTPEFIRDMADAGYRDVPAETLVKLRIFGITPRFAQQAASRTGSKPSAEALVKMRLTGMMPRVDARKWQRDWDRNWRWNDDAAD